MNMDILISPQGIHLISFGYILRKGIAGLYGSSILTSWGTSILFSIMAITFIFLVTGINFSPCLWLSSVQLLSRVWLFATRGLQQARLPCPSPTPRVYSNSCPLCQWCHPTISSFIVPSPPSFNRSQHLGLFQWVSSSHQVAKVLELQLQHQSFQWTPRADLLQNELVGSPCSPRDSQESSPTSLFKSINSSVLSFVYSPTFTSIHDYWKNQ